MSVCVPMLSMTDEAVERLTDDLAARISVRYEVVIADCAGQLMGYTAPMNAAMGIADGRYLAAMNDDVTLADGWLEPLLDELRLSDAWCVTPDATHTDGPQVFHPWLMVWHADKWRKLGGLDPQFRHWCSDIDIARRLVDAGHPPVKVMLPRPVTHMLGASSGDPALGPIVTADLSRFAAKWGVEAEYEKHRLAGLA